MIKVPIFTADFDPHHIRHTINRTIVMRLILSELILLITKKQERNIWILIKFFIALTAMVTVYSVLFHFLMIFENREFSHRLLLDTDGYVHPWIW